MESSKKLFPPLSSNGSQNFPKQFLKSFISLRSPACLQSKHLLASTGRYPGIGVWSENLLEWSFQQNKLPVVSFPCKGLKKDSLPWKIGLEVPKCTLSGTRESEHAQKRLPCRALAMLRGDLSLSIRLMENMLYSNQKSKLKRSC